MRGIKIVQKLFRRRINQATKRALDELARASDRHRGETAAALGKLSGEQGPKVLLGTTEWGQRVDLALDQAATHGLVLGASGAGKSYLALSIFFQMLDMLFSQTCVSIGLVDAKGELFEKCIQYLYAYLYRLKPSQRETIRKKIFIIDFSSSRLVAPYNILAHQEYLADELMVANRIDTISEQFSGLSEMSVRMKMILKYFLLLLAEFELPLAFFERLCIDPWLLSELTEKSQNPQVRDYFQNRFDDESKSTLLALRQRIDALLISEGVRLSLSADSAPDFTKLQDGGAIILINTAGRTITRGVSELLQGLILSDIKQSVFRRSKPEQKFIWFLDEAQNLFKTAANREHMVDLLTMARSFGSYFILLTQSLTSAVRDQDILNSILANVRWVVMLRSTLRDAELIAPGIAVTGMVAKPKHTPFEPAKLMSESEELKASLKEITKLPDRMAYCWLKAYLHTVVKIKTPYVPASHEIAGCSQEEFAAFIRSEEIGQGVSSREINKAMDRHQKRLKTLPRLATTVLPTVGNEKRAKKEGERKLVKTLEEKYRAKK